MWHGHALSWLTTIVAIVYTTAQDAPSGIDPPTTPLIEEIFVGRCAYQGPSPTHTFAMLELDCSLKRATQMNVYFVGSDDINKNDHKHIH